MSLNFVLELFCEEIPAKMQKLAVENFSRIAAEVLQKNNLLCQQSDIQAYISPRRMVLMINNLSASQIQSSQKKVGPKVDAEKKAIEGFLKSNGLKTPDELEIVDGFYIFHKKANTIPTVDILALSVPMILQKMQSYWPKIMRYDVAEDVQVKWIRPIRSILALLENEIVNFNFAALDSANFSYDKFNNKILVKGANDYDKIMSENNIIYNQNLRKRIIIERIVKVSTENNIKPIIDFENSSLLDEIIGLCEYPTVLIGNIDTKFLELPSEALILALQNNQKYICCKDFNGHFSSKFIFICDCVINEKNRPKIIHDNEKIMRARLSDIEFFVQEDLQKPLIENVYKLKNIIHHQQIGSMHDKIERFKELTKFLSVFIAHCDITLVDRAVELAKVDLCLKAVAELPELQGYFGSFYAYKQLENHKIVEAIAEHYLPSSANSKLPQTPLATALAIADKIDNIVSFFLVGQKPTSSKDPYGLRRSSLGLIRMAHHYQISLPIRILIERSLKTFNPKILKNLLGDDKKQFFESKKILVEEIILFVLERLKTYLRDQENIRIDILNLVIGNYQKNIENEKAFDVLFIIKMAKFFNDFVVGEKNRNLIELYKRSANILAIEEKKDGMVFAGKPSVLAFKNKYEKNLYGAIKNISKDYKKFINKAEFENAINLLVEIEEPLKDFFLNVMVNDVDNSARVNRLILLSLIRDLFNQIGDFSKIEL